MAGTMPVSGRRRQRHMDVERQKQLDEALTRMRAAFADVPEEQLIEDVAEIVRQNRELRREQASAYLR